MDKRVIEVRVEACIEVTLDADAFTPEFLEEYANTITRFHGVMNQKSMLKRHAEQLAYLNVQGQTDGEIVEGYGKLSDMGISFSDPTWEIASWYMIPEEEED